MNVNHLTKYILSDEQFIDHTARPGVATLGVCRSNTIERRATSIDSRRLEMPAKVNKSPAAMATTAVINAHGVSLLVVYTTA